jgi:hypothetical protein
MECNCLESWGEPPIFATRLKKGFFRGTLAQAVQPDFRNRKEKQAQSGT